MVSKMRKFLQLRNPQRLLAEAAMAQPKVKELVQISHIFNKYAVH
jgi:hypothetical protein